MNEIFLPPPLRYRYFGLALICMVIGAAFFILTVEYAAVRKVAGEIQPRGGYVDVLAPFTAGVKEYVVPNGSLVNAGDNIIKIENIKSLYANGRLLTSIQPFAEYKLRALEQSKKLVAARHEAKVSQIRLKMNALENNKAEFSGQLKFMLDKLDLAIAEAELYKKLFEKNLISRALLVEKEALLLEMRMNASSMEGRYRLLDVEISELKGAIEQSDIETKIHLKEMAVELNSLEQQKTERELDLFTTLKAPIAGTVNFKNMERKGSILVDAVIATIIPIQANLEGKVEVPADIMGSVRPDQSVKIKVRSPNFNDYEYLNGRIASLAKAPTDTMNPASSGRTFTALIKFDSTAISGEAEKDLIPGMLFEAEIALQKKTIAAWLFRNLIL